MKKTAANATASPVRDDAKRRIGSDAPFLVGMTVLGGAYVVLIVAMLAADATFTSIPSMLATLESPDIRFSMWLSIISCTASAVLSVVVAVPIGFLMSRKSFWGKSLIDSVLDVPIVLPPLVVGLSLLILFQIKIRGDATLDDLITGALNAVGISVRSITYEVPAVILAQFTVACAFSVRTMRVTFDQIDPRVENVALTLGCNLRQAFFAVTMPQAWRGVVAAFTLAWARSLGEFGPILIFAGATRMRTEVLSTSVFLEFSVGNLDGAVAVSMIMVTVAMIVLILARVLGMSRAMV